MDEQWVMIPGGIRAARGAPPVQPTGRLPVRAAGECRGADVVSSIVRPAASDQIQALHALTANERSCLRRWQIAARDLGIDLVEDLADRPWPCQVAAAVIGVYQAGRETASWLVIGHNGRWAVADCAAGTVSRAVASLADALALVCPIHDDGSTWQ